MGSTMAEIRPIDLYEFLVESELQHYYSSIKDELKITNASHLKYATDEDLRQIGFSKPEIRRLRKYYEKYYPHGYLSKIKRLLQPPLRRDDNQMVSFLNSTEATKVASLPSKTPTQKHIIPADLISVNKQLGAGEFGVVQQGVWTNGTERIQVAIKCLCRERMQSNPIEFLKEAAIMHAIEHENIVRLYGVVLDTNSLMLVTELAHLRSLLECLKDSGLRVNFLTVPTLCEFAMQICNGMMYLENKRLIHRDLAARNILVFSKNKVKISDFGLSRALGVGKDYYKTNFNVNLKLPIAWCAPECITFLRFTNASDVWAYGVCLWEMFSYGFQPWAALTGLQILEAIDDPNFQRLEQPECCPKEYYNLMLRCWQHEPTKRPKFNEIYSSLPDMKPEQLKTAVNNCEPKKDHLLFLQGEIITVLDKNTNSPFWKGVLSSGKTGLFNPSNTVAYLEGLPISTNRDSFFRTSERLSKKKLRSEMISMPQNDLKHTLHIGLDGACFGDVSLLGSSQQSNHLPKQIVTPYKPSEDIEQTPLLLPPTPTSPDSIQTASTYFPEENQTISQTNPSFVNSNQNTPQNHNFNNTFEFPPKQTTAFSSSNPFASEPFDSPKSDSNKKDETNENNAFSNSNLQNDNLVQDFKTNNNPNWSSSITDGGSIEIQHEYHEISDDEMIVEKFDYGPSLLDEINTMFGCINMANDEINIAKLQGNLVNSKAGEVVELDLKVTRKNNVNDNNGNKTKKKSCGTVKQISVKDEKILNQAIEIANEISAKSMTDLVSDTSQTTRSPKRKFSFRLPHLTHNTTSKDHTISNYSNNSSNGTCNIQLKERKKFSEELQSISDLQNTITEEGREAYNSLIEKKSKMAFDSDLFNLVTTKTLPRNIFKLGDVPKTDLKKNRKALVTPISLNQNDHRPMTLPNRNNSKFNKVDEFLKNDFIQKQDIISKVQQNQTSKEKTLNGSNVVDEINNENSNPIPLPPRDRTKVIPTNPKRHVRKHPLIIPSNGMQRTLNKIIQQSPESEYPKHDMAGFDLRPKQNRLTLINNYNFQKDNKESENINKVNLKLTESIKGHNTMSAPTKPPRNNHNISCNKNLYANLDILHMNLKLCNTDSASLNFESALEHSFDQDDVLSSPDVTDSFCPFSIQKEESKKINFNNSKISGLYVNEDELRNLDFDPSDNGMGELLIHKKVLTSKSNTDMTPKSYTENQLTEEVVNNYRVNNVEEIKDQVDKFDNDNDTLFFSKERNFNNSVSCEDLLEFSNKKPKGCERGVDSDEVRIMLKVLGKEISPHKCLNALEIIDWDVHKAIKMIKLQNITNIENLSEVQNILHKYEWDLQMALFELNIMNEG